MMAATVYSAGGPGEIVKETLYNPGDEVTVSLPEYTGKARVCAVDTENGLPYRYLVEASIGGERRRFAVPAKSIEGEED